MTVFKPLAVAGVALALSAGAAFAVPIAPGSYFSISGAAQHEIPLNTGSVVTPTNADDEIKSTVGTFTDLTDGTAAAPASTDIQISSGDVNNGDTFSVDWSNALGSGTFTFLVTFTNTANVTTASDLSNTTASVIGSVEISDSAGIYDTTNGGWSFTYNTADRGEGDIAGGAWTLAVSVPTDVAPIPVPAALPMMVGGLALLGFVRRKSNA